MAVGSPKNHRARPYAIMLLLAFSAAIVGVVLLHKLREKRLFDILVQEKDQEMASLQFQLQKEKESGKDLKRKFEELKAKSVSLRSYKAGITHKLMEMQSLMASLRDDQRSLELAIEEKENRIKFLEEKESNATEGNLQAKALIEILKQKEAEIAEMKDRLQKPNSNDIWRALAYTPISNGPLSVPAVGIDGRGKGENAEEALLKTGGMEGTGAGASQGRGNLGEKDADGLLGKSGGNDPRSATGNGRGQASKAVANSDRVEMAKEQRLNIPRIGD